MIATPGYKASGVVYRTANECDSVYLPTIYTELKLTLADAPQQPTRWCAGTDAVGMVQAKIDSLQAELDAWRTLSLGTDGDFEFREEAGSSAWG
ncbi:MAG: hypothetical protein EON96_02625 [Caulobacteraceae bacterium]|nr:MAG: hypothetical protein EON96_02625 [Caulobacteraceae bacterium]